MAGGHSHYLAGKLGGLAFGGSSFSRPATVYLEPYTTLPDESGSGGVTPTHGYSSRLAVTNNSTNFPAASGGVKTLATVQTLYTATGADTIVGVGVWDASTGGNLLGVFVPGSTLTTASGKRVKITAGTLSLTLTGSWQAALANALLDHAFGGGDYTPQATWYVGLVQASGTTEITGTGYARQAVTNNTTNFPAWSGDATSNGADIVFGPATAADWSAAGRVGFYSALTGGTLEAVHDLDAGFTVGNGETGTFAAGDLDLTFIAAF